MPADKTSTAAAAPARSRKALSQRASGLWCCPRCKGDLERGNTGLRCLGCGHDYEEIDGIADLRVPGDSWIDFSEDSATARELAAKDLPLDDMVRAVYAGRPGLDHAWVERRVVEILGAPTRLAEDVAGWLQPAMKDGVFLDLGCGSGVLLAAAARRGHASIGIGVDVSMTWLVVARRMILAHGGTPVLAAALGEFLPLSDAVLDGVVSLDVIEHVSDPEVFLRELNRVSAPDGRLALSMPNRLSLTAEPHVHVWGVGWLPHACQARYVLWRSGKHYGNTRLLTSFGLGRLLKRCSSFSYEMHIPRVPAANIRMFPPAKAWLARVYNAVCDNWLLRPLLLAVGPFFRITGVKRSVR